MRYMAGWNLPGCLPDMEPVTFATLDEAQAFLDEVQDDLAERLDWYDPADDHYVYWVEPVN